VRLHARDVARLCDARDVALLEHPLLLPLPVLFFFLPLLLPMLRKAIAARALARRGRRLTNDADSDDVLLALRQRRQRPRPPFRVRLDLLAAVVLVALPVLVLGAAAVPGLLLRPLLSLRLLLLQHDRLCAGRKRAPCRKVSQGRRRQ
jgi:hypothetical protein